MNKETVTQILMWGLGSLFSILVGAIAFFLIHTMAEFDTSKAMVVQTDKKLGELGVKMDDVWGEINDVKLELRGIKKKLQFSLRENEASRLRPARVQSQIDIAEDPYWESFATIKGERK